MFWKLHWVQGTKPLASDLKKYLEVSHLRYREKRLSECVWLGEDTDGPPWSTQRKKITQKCGQSITDPKNNDGTNEKEGGQQPSLYPNSHELLPTTSHTLVQAPIWHAITVQEKMWLKTQRAVPLATLIYVHDISGSETWYETSTTHKQHRRWTCA